VSDNDARKITPEESLAVSKDLLHDMTAQRDALRVENAKLKDQNERLLAREHTEVCAAMRAENQRLKAEHRKAEAHINRREMTMAEGWRRFTDTQLENQQLKSDPRLQCPLDGPGSHRVDLAELRRKQEEVKSLKAQIQKMHDAGLGEVDTGGTCLEQAMTEIERLKREVEGLNEALGIKTDVEGGG
jgi:hypothetical protein